MKGKYLISIVAAVAVASVSCQKTDVIAVENGVPATLTVSIANDLTKASATATSAESALDPAKVYLFVFKADGSREVGQAVTLSSGAATVNVTAGEKTVWVVANCPATVLESATYAAFKTKVSALSDNTSRFVMAGSAAKTISGNDSVSITLRRLASKVCLVNLTRDFTDPNYSASTLTVNRIYLSNACGECYYYSDGSTPTAIDPASVSVWYNKLGVYSLGSGDPVSLLAATIGTNLPNGSSYTTEQVMYAYPNACVTNTIGGSWNMSASPRHTRLVIDCSLAGTQGYYSVSLPVMDSNKVYNVSLTVCKKPSDSPEDNTPEIDPALSFTASVSVADWDAPISIVENL